MATFLPSSLLKPVGFLFVILTTINSQVNGCFTSIFSFGDSLTDTGNLLQISISSSRKLPESAFPPNGQTFFHHPVGRRCDGRLVIDFLAEGLGLPSLPTYFGTKGRAQNFQNGVNFAVAGATALDAAFLEERGFHSESTNVSLEVEVGFFKDVLPSLCSSSSDCKELLQRSLIVMGEIGGNDYNHGFWVGKNTEEVQQIAPLVVQIIASAINELIELGAVTFLVPGNLPIGCSPAMLTYFQVSDKENYDPLTDCLTWANQFSEYHNELLQQELEKLRKLHPNVNIIYVDYYNTAMRIYHSPKQFGMISLSLEQESVGYLDFNVIRIWVDYMNVFGIIPGFRETLRACCGMGGLYNYNPSLSCGYPPLRSCCNDPSSFVSWDGVHYTEATYRILYKAVLEGLNTIPGLNSLCPSLTENNKLSSSS